jgi:hypothetical protein
VLISFFFQKKLATKQRVLALCRAAIGFRCVASPRRPHPLSNDFSRATPDTETHVIIHSVEPHWERKCHIDGADHAISIKSRLSPKPAFILATFSSLHCRRFTTRLTSPYRTLFVSRPNLDDTRIYSSCNYVHGRMIAPRHSFPSYP